MRRAPSPGVLGAQVADRRRRGDRLGIDFDMQDRRQAGGRPPGRRRRIGRSARPRRSRHRHAKGGEIRVAQPGRVRPPGIMFSCMRMVPNMPLSTTTLMVGALYCMAVATLAMHHETAVAGKGHRHAIGTGDLGGHRRRHAIAYRARGRRQLRAIALVEIAMDPGGVIAGAVTDEGVFRQITVEPADNLAHLHIAGAGLRGQAGLEGGAAGGQPFGPSGAIDRRQRAGGAGEAARARQNRQFRR